MSRTLSDPVILYDKSSDRWFSVIMDLSSDERGPCTGGCYIDLAISKTNDPTSEWNIFRIPFGLDLADFPMVGLSDDKFAFGVNLFGRGYLGTQSVIIDKIGLIKNDTSPSISRSPIYQNYFTIFPVTSTKTECMYMQAQDYRLGDPFSEGIILFTICGNPSTNNTEISTTNIPIIRSFLPPSRAIQPNNIVSETDSVKIRGPTYYNNTIISAFHVTCEDDEGNRQTCIRIAETSTNSSNSDSITFFLNNAHVMYPSISMDKNGDIIMVFQVSSEQIYPSILVAKFDKNFEESEVIPLIVGTANTNVPEERPRFGDYSTAVTDPVDGSVWVSGEYGDKSLSGTDLKWSTYVAKIS